MTRVPLLLVSLAVVLAAVLALELLAGPDPDDDLPARPAAPAAADPASAGAAAGKDGKDDADDTLDGPVQTILARPLFSQGRRPAAVAAGAGGGDSDTLPRLAGVIVAPGGSRAIFAPAQGRALVVAEGARIGRYVVRTIAPGQVTLSDAERDLVLRPSLAKGGMP
jgi:hypothetical protein